MSLSCRYFCFGLAGSRALDSARASAKMHMRVHYLYLKGVLPARPISMSIMQNGLQFATGLFRVATF